MVPSRSLKYILPVVKFPPAFNFENFVDICKCIGDDDKIKNNKKNESGGWVETLDDKTRGTKSRATFTLKIRTKNVLQSYKTIFYV
jgi:hypothetical protein